MTPFVLGMFWILCTALLPVLAEPPLYWVAEYSHFVWDGWDAASIIRQCSALLLTIGNLSYAWVFLPVSGLLGFQFLVNCIQYRVIPC